MDVVIYVQVLPSHYSYSGLVYVFGILFFLGGLLRYILDFNKLATKGNT